MAVGDDDAVVAENGGRVFGRYEFEAQAVRRDLELSGSVREERLRLAKKPLVPLGGGRREEGLAVRHHIPLEVSAAVLQASVFLVHRGARNASLLEGEH